MFNLTLMHFDGQAYELTDRYAAPQSSSGCLYRDDPYSTFQLIASLPLQPHDWFSILRRASASPIKFGSNHPGEIYQTVTDALMRGDLRLYRLPRVNAFNSLRGKNNIGLCIIPGPKPHCATRFKPEIITSLQAVRQLLGDMGISDETLLGFLSFKNLYNHDQQREPINEVLQLLAKGELLAYKIPLLPSAPPVKAVEYESVSGPMYEPVPLAPPSDPKLSSNKTEKSQLQPYEGGKIYKREHIGGNGKDPYTLTENGKPLGAKEGVMPKHAKGLKEFPDDYLSLIPEGYPDVNSRKDYKNFSDITPKKLPPGTKIYRIVDEGSSEASGKSGCYWAYTKPANKAEWRSNYAVKDSWNDNGYYVEHVVGEKGLKVWEGKVAGQEYLEHEGKEFYLEGGETQLYVSFNALGSLSPRLTNWSEA
jgi:hypothetical protein